MFNVIVGVFEVFEFVCNRFWIGGEVFCGIVVVFIDGVRWGGVGVVLFV